MTIFNIINIEVLKLLFLILILSIFLTTILLFAQKYNILKATETSKNPQNIHVNEVSRIGGIVIFGIIILECLFINYFKEKEYLYILIASTPAFISGFIEDITAKINPKLRLISSILSGILFVYLTSYVIKSIGIGFIDYFLSFDIVSILLTIIAISTLINAFNIIDGMNGLSLGSAIIMIFTVMFISFVIDDYLLFKIMLGVIIPIISVFLFNFPYGKIFIGDGGAYLLGFLVSISVILISQRNELVSPFASLLIILYPFYEMIRTIIRRKAVSNDIMLPDDMHLHSLIYKLFLKKTKNTFLNTNALTTITIIILPLFCCLWTLLFYTNTFIICLGIMLFLISYELILYKTKKTLNNCYTY